MERQLSGAGMVIYPLPCDQEFESGGSRFDASLLNSCNS
jgi:hypothetical protein